MAPKGKTKSGPQKRMTRWDEARIGHIHNEIYNKKFPTCESLARDLGVSVDTIERDIAYMRLYKKAPIEVSRKAGQSGYYYSKPVAARLGNSFDEQEVVNFLIGHRALEKVPVKSHQKRLGLGFEKISQLLDPRTQQLLDDLKDSVYFRPFAPEQIDIESFMSLAESIRHKSVVTCSYKKHMAEKPDLKELCPWCFICAANSWYMIAFDLKSQEPRTYMLSRLSAVEFTEQKFIKKPKNFNLDNHLDGAFIILKGKESHDVVVEFDAWASAYIRNRVFTRDQKVEELNNGGLRISMHLTALEEVEAWICYWRTHARAVGPAALVNRLHDYGQYLIKAHPRVELK